METCMELLQINWKIQMMWKIKQFVQYNKHWICFKFPIQCYSKFHGFFLCSQIKITQFVEFCCSRAQLIYEEFQILLFKYFHVCTALIENHHISRCFQTITFFYYHELIHWSFYHEHKFLIIIFWHVHEIQTQFSCNHFPFRYSKKPHFE